MKPIILYKNCRYYYIEQNNYLRMTLGEKLYYDTTSKFKKTIVSFSSFRDLCLDFLFNTSKTTGIMQQVDEFCMYNDSYVLLSKKNRDLVFNNTKIQIYENTKDYFNLGCSKVRLKVYKKIKTLITIDKYTLIINKKNIKD